MPRTCYNVRICFLSLYVIIIQLQSIRSIVFKRVNTFCGGGGGGGALGRVESNNCAINILIY